MFPNFVGTSTFIPMHIGGAVSAVKALSDSKAVAIFSWYSLYLNIRNSTFPQVASL